MIYFSYFFSLSFYLANLSTNNKEKKFKLEIYIKVFNFADMQVLKSHALAFFKTELLLVKYTIMIKDIIKINNAIDI